MELRQNKMICGFLQGSLSVRQSLVMRECNAQSRGYWMISKVFHPEVSDQCADDLKCSTAWALSRILDDHIQDWTTFKFCRVWYDDCPF